MTNKRSHRLVGLMAFCAVVPASLALASIPMPTPQDYEGESILQVDVPDGAILQLLLDEGVRSMACTPARERDRVDEHEVLHRFTGS